MDPRISVQYRTAEGLADSTLAIGVLEDVGFLARERHQLQALRITPMNFQYEQDPVVKNGFGVTAGCVSPGHVVVGLRSTQPLLSPRRVRACCCTAIEKVEGGSNGSETKVPGLDSMGCGISLRRAGASPRLATAVTAEFLASEMGATFFHFMMRNDEAPVLEAPLAKVVADSLVNIELRNWFRQRVGVPFLLCTSLLELFPPTFLERLERTCSWD